jgi:hypothetical protein
MPFVKSFQMMRGAMVSVLAPSIAVLLMAACGGEPAAAASQPVSARGADALSMEAESVNTLHPARHDSFRVDEDSGPAELDVLANDASGTVSSVQSEDSGEHLAPQGTAALSDTGVVTYTPPARFFGVDSFTYTWKGAGGSTAEATVQVVVVPIHPPPTARKDCSQGVMDPGPTPVSDGNDSTAETRVPATSGADCHQRDDAVQVAAGSQYTVARKEDGTVWAWGSNAFGQLGNATTQTSLLPVPVSNLPQMKAIAAGDNHTAAVSKNGHGCSG